MKLKNLLGTHIRKLRNERRLSQEALGAMSETSLESISKIERGLSLPTLTTLESIAKALNISMEELLFPILHNPAKNKTSGQKSILIQRLINIAETLDEASLEIAIKQIKVLTHNKKDQ